jgi:UDP-glucuronate 4-epimerase
VLFAFVFVIRYTRGMTILVTGACGAIGSHVAEALKEAGHHVIGVDCFTPYYARPLKDLNRREVEEKGVHELAPLVSAVEVIFHFAAQPGISESTPFVDYVNNNIYATQRLLEEVKRQGHIKLFVHASTSSVYGAFASSDETTEVKPTSAYGATKLAAEQLALAYQRDQGVPVTVLRIFSAYGERERPEKLYHKFIKAVLEETPFPLHEGSEKHIRSYSYVGDIVNGCMLALAHKEKVIGEIFNIGSDKTVTTGEGLTLVEEILGKKAQIIQTPKRAGDQLETSATIAKARTVLGYRPMMTLSEGLRRQIAWYTKSVFGKM